MSAVFSDGMFYYGAAARSLFGTPVKATVAPDKAPHAIWEGGKWEGGRFWRQRHGLPTPGRNRGKGSTARRKLERLRRKVEAIEEWRRDDVTSKRQLWADNDRLQGRVEQAETAMRKQTDELEEKGKQLVPVLQVPTLTQVSWQRGLQFHKGRVVKMRKKLARAFAEVGVMGEEFRGVEEQQMQERNGQHQWGREQQARVSALQREMRLAEEREEQRVARDKGLVEARTCTEQKLQLQRWVAEAVAREAGAGEVMMQKQLELAGQMRQVTQYGLGRMWSRQHEEEERRSKCRVSVVHEQERASGFPGGMRTSYAGAVPRLVPTRAAGAVSEVEAPAVVAAADAPVLAAGLRMDAEVAGAEARAATEAKRSQELRKMHAAEEARIRKPFKPKTCGECDVRPAVIDGWCGSCTAMTQSERVQQRERFDAGLGPAEELGSCVECRVRPRLMEGLCYDCLGGVPGV
jgi:hypothetical protein